MITLLNLDGWMLNHTGEGSQSWDAEGTTPKHQECVIEMKFRNKYYDTKIIEKDKERAELEVEIIELDEFIEHESTGMAVDFNNSTEDLEFTINEEDDILRGTRPLNVIW